MQICDKSRLQIRTPSKTTESWFKILKSGKHSCMKRMFVFLFVLMCLCFVFSYKKPATLALESLKGEYSLYLNSKNKNPLPAFAKVVQNGAGEIVSCDISQMNDIFVDENLVAGESVKVEQNDYTYEQICKTLNFVAKKTYEFSDGLKTFYGEADYGDKFVFVGSDKINCEIAINNDFIYIGFPVILGSY